MMAVTAKVKVSNKQQHENGVTLAFAPDYQDGRNKEWAVRTPSLSLTMTVLDRVAEQFEVGDAVTLTFEKDDAGAQSDAQGEQG